MGLLFRQDHPLLRADGAERFPGLPVALIHGQGTIDRSRCVVTILSTLQIQLRGDRVEAASSDTPVIFDDFLERLDLGL
ncbi:hypothetical protein D3C76_1241300 [compost metagenome]